MIVRHFLLSAQVPMWPMAGERCGWWQLGKSSHWPTSVTWWRGGCWTLDRDTSGAGFSIAECADSAGIAWQPKQCVQTNGTFFSTMVDLVVGSLTTLTNFAHCITSLLSPCPRPFEFDIIHPHVAIFNSSWFLLSGMLAVEVQEDMREAANNLVKHFHKPEQEVCGCIVIVPLWDSAYIYLTC